VRGVDELAGELQAVAERLPDGGDLAGREAGDALHDGEAAAVELGRLDVGPFLLRAMTGGDRVPPRLRVGCGPVVVEREELRHVVGVRARSALDRLRDAGVQVAAAAVREAVVRGVADEGMAEAEGAGHVGVALDKLLQPLPGLGVRGSRRVVRQHLGNEGAREGGAEHRSPAQQGPVGRSEPVDPRSDERLHVRGQLLRLVGRLLRRGELLKEERVAAASRGDRFELVVADAPVPGRCGDQCLRVRLRQRLQAEREGR
jgi:hypothetical protein